MRNIAGFRIPPGETDRPGIGNGLLPVLAENEQLCRELGWPTFGEDQGVEPGQSAVTVQSMFAASTPINHGGDLDKTGDPYLILRLLVELWAKAMSGYWFFTGLAFGNWDPLLILSPGYAEILHRNGMTKDDVRQYIFNNARVPAGGLERRLSGCFNVTLAEQVANGSIPSLFHESDDPNRLIPVFLRPEDIAIVVSGRPKEGYQRGFINNHGHGVRTTKVIYESVPAVSA